MLRGLFKKKKTMKIPSKDAQNDVPEGIMMKCPKCEEVELTAELLKQGKVCSKCGHHYTMTAHERVDYMFDEGTFESFDDHLQTVNPLQFPSYMEKIEGDQKKTDLNEAVLTGTGTIEGERIVVAIMDSHFRMGSMGSVVGEKITRAVEYATEHRLPVVIFSASGGARMQEGIISLMQMAKTSVALRRHSEAGLLYVSVMTYPTTGERLL